MTLTIDLPEDEVQVLAAKARAQGISPEQYVRLVLVKGTAGCFAIHP
jgi:hypothetical protein